MKKGKKSKEKKKSPKKNLQEQIQEKIKEKISKKKAETVVEFFMFDIFPVSKKSSSENQNKKSRPKRKKIPVNPIIVID